MKLTKPLLFIVLLSVLCATLVGLGFGAAWYVLTQRFAAPVALSRQIETLGGLLAENAAAGHLTEIQRSDFHSVYHSGADIEPSLDTIAWTGRVALTPFVGAAQWPGKHHNAQINSMQFRSAHELVQPKPDGVFRIFITGGSTAYGSGAPSQDTTIGAYLERYLNQSTTARTGLTYEVFTLANPAWASTHERIVIENRLIELEPDLVLSFSGNNDVFWAHAGKNILWFNDYAWNYFIGLVNTAYHIAGYEPMPRVTHDATAPVSVDIVAARLRHNTRLAAYALAMAHSRYVFVLQPTLAVTGKALSAREAAFINDAKGYYNEAYGNIGAALAAIDEENFDFIDLSRVFDALGDDDEIFLDSFHFGDKGNELIAKALYRQLGEQTLLTPVSP